MNPLNPLQAVAAVGRYAAVPFMRRIEPEKPTAFIIGFSPWKTFIKDWLPNHNVVRFTRTFRRYEFATRIAPQILGTRGAEIYVWGFKSTRYLERFCTRHNIPLIRVEDGFMRSVQLGALGVPPLSICFDRSGIYFDSTRPSDLEHLLQTYDFDAHEGLEERSRAAMELFLSSGLSKYNTGKALTAEQVYGPKSRRRVLVVGQVEGDQSLLKGCARKISNNDLVRLAHRENPGAEIIYKPHPEVLAGTRKDPPQSNPDDVLGYAMVVKEPISLAESFKTIDHVYTMTSLSGFEALIRGIPVTCFGAPFYSNWGLTDDRQRVERRTRKLTIEQLFAGAYLLYPKYIDPILGQQIEFEEALHHLQMEKIAFDAKPVPAKPEPKQVEPTAPKPTAIAAPEVFTTIRRLLDLVDPPKVSPKKPSPTIKRPVPKPIKRR